MTRRLSLVTLGCARNEVDSEELAGRLDAAGWELTDDAPDVVVVNTCGFVESAKKDSIDTLLAASDTGAKVVAVGCLAERYGKELAAQLPEADAVLGFDSYADLSDHLSAVLDGARLPSHTPGDRRKLLPVSPVERQRPAADQSVGIPGHAGGPTVLRKRLDDSPVAPLKLASGCDRRCSFCAIPSFRGAFVSRRPSDVLAEARWLADHGVKELVLVSENSTSYGKDLGDLTLLETLLPELARIVPRVRLSYLQPAEMRASLVEVLTTTEGVVPYFDMSFQHASASVLRRMRRFGDTESFLGLLGKVRELAPTAGVRSNVIVGFPGETEDDVAELERFLIAARLDAIGVFGYSDEDGTEAETLPDHLPQEVVDERVARLTGLVEELTSQRAEERYGEKVSVLVETVDDGQAEGRALHQAPEVDGSTVVRMGIPNAVPGASNARWGSPMALRDLRVGDVVEAVVVGSEGVDLVAERT
ncbi:MAG: 30S ribosomal protein S12 methylthiotransferase RimO [Actinomycetota bacterium]|nr:30S ribosomal protein S12 methylthiotransferase RimO [Actinomycetota bacterium]